MITKLRLKHYKSELFEIDVIKEHVFAFLYSCPGFFVHSFSSILKFPDVSFKMSYHQRKTTKILRENKQKSIMGVMNDQPKAKTARETFSLVQATQHFFLMLHGLWNQNIEHVARGRFCNKIAGTILQNIHRIQLLVTCCRHWRCVTTRTTAFDFYCRTVLRMWS